MKKKIAAALMLAAVIGMCGCQSRASEDAATFTAKPTESTTTTVSVTPVQELPEVDPDEMKSLFKAPAQTVQIDTTQEDPSTAEMKFLFDDKKRIVGISYMIGEHPIMVNYAYVEDTSVKIVAFAESVIVDQKKYDLPAFDAAAGFTEKDGYYFYGYKFE